MDRNAAHLAARRLVDNVELVIRGKHAAVELAATALFAGGHLLIEDVPGVGKTMLGRAIARSISGSFKRIQATPDLLPSDITGSNVYESPTQRFQFVPGPVFANVVLIDEINRTTPRTQSALLEAMEESAVTVDGVRHPLPDPLFMIATQNPLEHHGTFPLPEGQLDRFSIAMDIGYVDEATERLFVRAQLGSHPIEELEAVLTPDDILGIRRAVRTTHVAEPVLAYALALVGGTRRHADAELGGSPRASITLVRCAQARAVIAGRDFVVPDDVKALAVSALSHRIIVRGSSGDTERMKRLVKDVLDATQVPLFDDRVTSVPPAASR
ncbi:MAG: AAA family ATPase [Actinomycetota bacterium]